jgi:hypothetical protein
MADNSDIDDTDQGRLPPSEIASLASRSDIDLDAMSTEELLTLIEDVIDRLPVEPRRDCRRQKFVSHAARG